MLVTMLVKFLVKVLGKKLVYVATDDERIHAKVKTFGFQTISTSKNCLTGTDRVAEASKKINSAIYINVQGDEPLIDPELIKLVAKALQENDVNYVSACSNFDKFSLISSSAKVLKNTSSNASGEFKSNLIPSWCILSCNLIFRFFEIL